jgi:NDP-sugar pyrophosphorylase family protein
VSGKGTRLFPLTDEIPNAYVASVARRPVIGHTFELLREAGVKEVYVATSATWPMSFMKHYGRETWINGMTVNLTRETELMGTAKGSSE